MTTKHHRSVTPARRTAPRSPERLALLTAICERIADGALTEDAAKAEGMTARTIREWVHDDPQLAPLYARAREDAADALAEQALRIALKSTAATYQQDRLKVDTLKWIAAKRRPREYGDKMQLTDTEDQPLVVRWVTEDRRRTAG